MRANEVGRLADVEVLPALNTWANSERNATAMVVALIAVADGRKLYLPEGFPSMSAYCVHKLGLSEPAAYKRIEVARRAREFPAIFPALEDGRLHLTAVLLLAPYLTAGRAEELLGAAAHKTKAEIEELLAERFPRSEVLPLVQPLATSASQLAPERVQESSSDRSNVAECEEEQPRQLAPERVGRTKPIARERYLWQLTVGRSAQEKLVYARDLLSHQVPSGDIAEVLERGLEALIAKLEKGKFAATDRPRANHRPAGGKRTVPSHVRRAVQERDGGQCTFVGDSGHRCGARKFLELDHIIPVARGGEATEGNLRQRCRAHNQLEAERAFGEGFMREKREKALSAVRLQPETREGPAPDRQSEDLMAGLRELGFRAEQVRRASEFTATTTCATLEERMRAALRYLCPRGRK